MRSFKKPGMVLLLGTLAFSAFGATRLSYYPPPPFKLFFDEQFLPHHEGAIEWSLGERFSLGVNVAVAQGEDQYWERLSIPLRWWWPLNDWKVFSGAGSAIYPLFRWGFWSPENEMNWYLMAVEPFFSDIRIGFLGVSLYFRFSLSNPWRGGTESWELFAVPTMGMNFSWTFE